jgi:hypothetical protein
VDAKTFDALVARLASGPSRRAAVQTLLAGALASAALPIVAAAKKGKGKRRHGKQRKGRGDDGQRTNHQDRDTHHNGKRHADATGGQGQDQVGAAARKKRFCLCQGTSAAQCTPANCVECAYQGKLGKKARKRLRKQFPFSFTVSDASECPGTTPTTTTTPPPVPTTTTTPRPTTTTTSTPRPPTTTAAPTTTTTTTSTTTTPPPPCPGGRVELSNGTCALPCTVSVQCTDMGCEGCVGTATGDFCRNSGPLDGCTTDDSCPPGQLCSTEAGIFVCVAAC